MFITPPQVLAAGACSAAATVQAQDSGGNAVNLTTATTVTLTSTSGTTVFYNSPTCRGATTNMSIGVGANQASFYFSDSSVGTPTLIAAALGLTDGTQTVTIVAASSPRLMFITPPQTLGVNVCSAVATIQSQDASGAPLNVAVSLAVDVSAVPSSDFRFFGSAVCSGQGWVAKSLSITNNTNSADVYFRGTAAGTVTITATAAGYTDATQQETFQ